MTVIERMARAMAKVLTPGWDVIYANKRQWIRDHGKYQRIPGPFKDDLLDAARATLAALREPTAKMLRVGGDAGVISLLTDGMTEGDVAGATWKVMIDAALADGDTRERPKDAPG